MSEDAEPNRNISGGPAGGGEIDSFEGDDGGTRAAAVVDRLGELYWQKTYGGRDAFECLVRTILSQNTSDAASQPAHEALLERYGNRDGPNDLAEALARADQNELAETIANAGLHNQKSARIIEIAELILSEYGSEAQFDSFVREEQPETVRETLLELNGVGPKTADCVLLFSGGRDGVFPVDTHVHRIYRRLGVVPPDADPEDVRATLERDVPPEKCGFGHTASIQFGREYCSAREPVCVDDPDACPLSDRCEMRGIDPDAGKVCDPAHTATGQ